MGALRAQMEPASNVERVEQEFYDFSYLVAHDLANEFRHVAEFSKLLGADLGEDAEAAQYACIIAQSAERCQKMLRAILAYSSIQTQKVLFRRWPARSIVERAMVELNASRPHQGASVEIDVAGEVYGDARLLIMAVRLGLENAFQFGRDGVPIKVDVRGANGENGAWRLEIVDNGEGLEKEYREKAFGMFWRLDPQTPGIGAGLAMIRRIARRHEGEAQLLDRASGACLELVVAGPKAVAP